MIKNKPFFVFTLIVVVALTIIDAMAIVPFNKYTQALIENFVVMGITIMFYFSLKHNQIVNVLFAICIFISIILLFLTILGVCGVIPDYIR